MLMEEQLDAIIDAIEEDLPTLTQQAQINALTVQMAELQKCVECHCSNIIKPTMKFSRKVKL